MFACRNLCSLALKPFSGVNTLACLQVILREVAKAIDGKYRACGYTEREKKVADLVLILGGPRLLYALHKECGLCSAATVRRYVDRPRFRTSAVLPTREDVRQNMSNFFLKRKGARALNSAMVDDVNGEGRPRPRPTDAALLGFGRQSKFPTSMTITDYGSLHEVFSHRCWQRRRKHCGINPYSWPFTRCRPADSQSLQTRGPHAAR